MTHEGSLPVRSTSLVAIGAAYRGLYMAVLYPTQQVVDECMVQER